MNESSMKILHLPLKEKWYRMIESDVLLWFHGTL